MFILFIDLCWKIWSILYIIQSDLPEINSYFVRVQRDVLSSGRKQIYYLFFTNINVKNSSLMELHLVMESDTLQIALYTIQNLKPSKVLINLESWESRKSLEIWKILKVETVSNSMMSKEVFTILLSNSSLKIFRTSI